MSVQDPDLGKILHSMDQRLREIETWIAIEVSDKQRRQRLTTQAIAAAGVVVGLLGVAAAIFF